MRYIIDGYNLIMSSGFSDDFDFNRAQTKREKLISLLASFKTNNRVNISVVFDGGKTDELDIGRQSIDGIDIYYSRGGQEADQVIKDIVEGLQNPREVTVVSSDKGITAYVKSLGASIESAQSFYGKIKQYKPAGPGYISEGAYSEKYLKGYDAEEERKQLRSKKKRK